MEAIVSDVRYASLFHSRFRKPFEERKTSVSESHGFSEVIQTVE
jgi:hypothetical protein